MDPVQHPDMLGLHALLDAMAGPAIVVDLEHRCLALNEAFQSVIVELYGTEIVVGQDVLASVTDPGDRDAVRNLLDRALAGETFSVNVWFGCGSYRRFYAVTCAPDLRDGRIVGAALTAFDITSLEHARETVAALSELVESSDDAMVTWAADGTITRWSHGAERLYGYAAQEVVGKQLAPIATRGGRGDFERAMRAVSAGDRVEHVSDTLQPKDGSRVLIDVTAVPLIARDGSVAGGTAVIRDITGQSAISEALRRSEQKFEAAFRSSPDAININRLSDGMYLEINQGFTDLTGYTQGDVQGRTSVELSIWDDAADRERLVRGLQAQGSVDRLEAQFRRRDGSVTTAEMSARIIEIDGEACILSVTRDISVRKSAQYALEASYERLEHMSHEVVQTLGRVVEARDPYTQGHEQRVAELCRLIGGQMGMPEKQLDLLETAALVHDIGKLSVPGEILTKPGDLSAAEFDLIKEHPRHSYEILAGIAFEWPIAELTLQHHERMDGSGYPRGMHGADIEPSARVLAVADVVEAMATHRPYRPALGLEAAAEELRANPQKYDHNVVEAFFALRDGGCVHL
jgi:PAS domain S-box-containing protein